MSFSLRFLSFSLRFWGVFGQTIALIGYGTLRSELGQEIFQNVRMRIFQDLFAFAENGGNL